MNKEAYEAGVKQVLFDVGITADEAEKTAADYGTSAALEEAGVTKVADGRLAPLLEAISRAAPRTKVLGGAGVGAGLGAGGTALGGGDLGDILAGAGIGAGAGAGGGAAMSPAVRSTLSRLLTRGGREAGAIEKARGAAPEAGAGIEALGGGLPGSFM